MAENDLERGNELEGGAQPSATSSDTQPHHSSQASQAATDVAERIKRLEAMVETMQSNKDKGVNKALTEVGELRQTLGEVQKLIKKGYSEDEAFEAIEAKKADDEFRQAVLELSKSLKSGSLPVQANGAQAKPSVIDVTELGLDANDPEVLANVLSQTDPKDAELAALRLLRKRGTTNFTPAAASPVSGQPSRPAGVEQLTEQYYNDMLAARGKPDLLKSIKDKARKAGVPVEQVVFS
jgi:hypothetical protein